jgi:hypothetical protein
MANQFFEVLDDLRVRQRTLSAGDLEIKRRGRYVSLVSLAEVLIERPHSRHLMLEMADKIYEWVRTIMSKYKKASSVRL